MQMTLIETLEHFPVQLVDLNGDQQAYREAGTGDQYLVLLHGISSGSGSWVNQLNELSPYFHVIAWDAPGYGLSDALTTQTPNAEDYAQRLAALFDVLQIQQAIVVGHSLGALQASAFARLYPQRVQQLIIANVAQGYQRYPAEQQAEVYAKRPKMLAELGNQGLALSRGPNLTYLKLPQTLALIECVMQNLHLGGFTQASYLLAYDEIRNYLKDLGGECVVVAGQQDSITPPQAIAELAQEMDCKKYIEIENAGHLSYVDQATAFNTIILSAQQQ
jgi:pimeloyl-ACP methyl ester carboxylesterase